MLYNPRNYTVVQGCIYYVQGCKLAFKCYSKLYCTYNEVYYKYSILHCKLQYSKDTAYFFKVYPSILE